MRHLTIFSNLLLSLNRDSIVSASINNVKLQVIKGHLFILHVTFSNYDVKVAFKYEEETFEFGYYL